MAEKAEIVHKSIMKRILFLIALAALIPAAAFARNNSHTIYGGYGARSYYPGGYTITGNESDSVSGGDSVAGSSADSVPGSSAYSTNRNVRVPEQPIVYAPTDVGSDYYVTGGRLYK